MYAVYISQRNKVRREKKGEYVTIKQCEKDREREEQLKEVILTKENSLGGRDDWREESER